MKILLLTFIIYNLINLTLQILDRDYYNYLCNPLIYLELPVSATPDMVR
jgi:hypothetical protein